ncbi:MAG: SGNH/GDSL hydrolase family protein, partial [Hyphomicrobium sp.]
MRFDAPLPKFSAALASGQPVRIIALGSSSTQGIGASSPKACYPVKLQAELSQRFPGNKITVENLGIGGQLATDMLRRIKNDVIGR